jgi:hypothetical protein
MTLGEVLARFLTMLAPEVFDERQIERTIPQPRVASPAHYRKGPMERKGS